MLLGNDIEDLEEKKGGDINQEQKQDSEVVIDKEDINQEGKEKYRVWWYIFRILKVEDDE